LPDICAPLEAPTNARKDGQQARYRRWCRENLPGEIGLSDDLCWELRSGVVHEGRYKHRGFDHVVFTVPNGGSLHNIIVERANERFLCLNAPFFCSVMVRCVQSWYDAHKDEKVIRNNLERLVQPRPDGFLPGFTGLVVMG